MNDPQPVQAGAELLEQAARERPGTPLPWAYRPEEYDDWGVIRTTVATNEGWHPIVAQARYDGAPTEDDLARHRLEGTDPAVLNARYIVHACNEYPTLTDELTRVREHIREQITFAESRIQDGKDMGASVWRIALEDVVRENRQALADQPK